MVTPREVRAARALLGWTRQHLADRAVVSLNSIIRMEQGTVDPRTSTLIAVRKVLETEGMVEIVKGHDRNRPQTICRITPAGRKRYLQYLSTLEQVVKDAAKGSKDESATLLRSLTPTEA